MKVLTLVLFTFSFLFVSCDKIDPDALQKWKEETAGNIASKAVPLVLKATNTTCQKPEVIVNILKDKILDLPFLKNQETIQKSVGGEICKVALKSVLPMVFQFGTTIITPPEAECVSEGTPPTIDKLVEFGCNFI